MDDRRNPVAPFGADALGDQHERRVLLAFEYLPDPFGQHDRRERTERLAVLDAAVENILHLGLARVGQQAAIAERARPELGTALKPADHLLIGEQFRGVAADIVAARGRGLNANQKFLRGLFDILIADRPCRHRNDPSRTSGAASEFPDSRNRRSRSRCRRRRPPAGSRRFRSRPRAPPGHWRRSSARRRRRCTRFLAPVVSRSQRARASSTFSVSS